MPHRHPHHSFRHHPNVRHHPNFRHYNNSFPIYQQPQDYIVLDNYDKPSTPSSSQDSTPPTNLINWPIIILIGVLILLLFKK